MATAIVLALGSGGCGSKPGAAKEEGHADHGGHEKGEKGRTGEKGEHGEEGGEHGEDGHEEPGKGVIELTPEQLISAKIATAKVEKRAEAGLLETTAQIEPAPDGQARVGVRIGGRVLTLKAGLGDAVKKGQVLATVDSPELGRAKADYLAAYTTAQVTRETADREKALFEKKISSERDWREAESAAVRARAEKEAAENRLHALGVSDAQLPRKVEGHYTSTLTITAPIEGVVVERPVSLGQMVEPADSLFTIMDLREVWLVMDVYERDLSQVKIGQRVRVRVAAYPKQEFDGTVQNIGAIVEVKTRAVKVRVALQNPDGMLKPGMFASVTLEGSTGEKREGLFVPEAAVQRDGEKYFVFLPRGEHDFEAREVELGHTRGGFVEIEKGVIEGDMVVTTGSFLLKAELKKSELGGGHSH